MKILTVCENGNNRSVHFAHRLKYWGHDIIPIGVRTNSSETIKMLCEWADIIILTSSEPHIAVPSEYISKVRLFDVGPDIYKRPFNPELDTKVKQLLEDNKSWLKV